MRILQSASKIVFLMLTFALITLTFKGIVPATDFVQLAGMAFVYYFTKQPDAPPSAL